jgi:hypothetical protein
LGCPVSAPLYAPLLEEGKSIITLFLGARTLRATISRESPSHLSTHFRAKSEIRGSDDFI